MSPASPVFKITPTAQQYEWGKVGRSSKVAQFAAASKVPDFALDENSPYAEVRRRTTSVSLRGTKGVCH